MSGCEIDEKMLDGMGKRIIKILETLHPSFSMKIPVDKYLFKLSINDIPMQKL